MNVLARLFGAIAKFFESRAKGLELAARLDRLESENLGLRQQMAQLRVDMGKCKMMVGLNQILDVTPSEV